MTMRRDAKTAMLMILLPLFCLCLFGCARIGTYCDQLGSALVGYPKTVTVAVPTPAPEVAPRPDYSWITTNCKRLIALGTTAQVVKVRRAGDPTCVAAAAAVETAVNVALDATATLDQAKSTAATVDAMLPLIGLIQGVLGPVPAPDPAATPAKPQSYAPPADLPLRTAIGFHADAPEFLLGSATPKSLFTGSDPMAVIDAGPPRLPASEPISVPSHSPVAAPILPPKSDGFPGAR